MAKFKDSRASTEDLGRSGRTLTSSYSLLDGKMLVVFAGLLGVSIWLASGGGKSLTHATSTPTLSTSTSATYTPLLSPSPSDTPTFEPITPSIGTATSPEIVTRTVIVRKGETLAGVLTAHGIDRRTAQNLIQVLEPAFAMKSLRAGQAIDLLFYPAAEDDSVANSFHGLIFHPTPERMIKAVRIAGDSFTVSDEALPLTLKVQHSDTIIDDNLYLAATKAGVPASVLHDLIRIFSFDVDFQREIQAGDKIELLFERFDLPSGETARHGNILYAALTLSGKKLPLYRFEPREKEVDYFDANGKSARKALIRTPIDGARLSSGFGMRHHPILGFSALHTGTDFAAPAGTPIYASGNGVVEFIGKKGGYGNYIQIRHNGTYSSAYAHAQSFAKGLHVGSRVAQGETIAYVGATGQATGPHLHYELIQNGKKINAMTVHLPSGEALTGNALVHFKAETLRVAELMNSLDEKGIAQALVGTENSTALHGQTETLPVSNSLK